MREQLSEKVSKSYSKHGQWLELSSMYEDDGKLTSQEVCLIDEGFNHCIFCTLIRTFNDLYPSELGHKPYLIYDPYFNEFTITIPTFTYLTKTDIANAIHYLVRNEVWCVFNVKVDGWNIAEFVTREHKDYKLDSDELRQINFQRSKMIKKEV